MKRRVARARQSALLLLVLGACHDGAAARGASDARTDPVPGSTEVLSAAASVEGSIEGPIEGHVEIRGKSIPVEIADSAAEQRKGLGERDALTWGTGMYFPYARPGFYAFWMKGMRFPIDIVFLREGRIIEIHPQVPFEPGGNGPTIQSRSLSDAVLEVPAGYAMASGWQVGDRVGFARLSAD